MVTWSKEKIIADLKMLKRKKAKPDPYELKEKYGFTLLSAFFPLLNCVAKENRRDLWKFIKTILSQVKDSRDLNFLTGECHCDNCK
jgi:hypothetical protein